MSYMPIIPGIDTRVGDCGTPFASRYVTPMIDSVSPPRLKCIMSIRSVWLPGNRSQSSVPARCRSALSLVRCTCVASPPKFWSPYTPGFSSRATIRQWGGCTQATASGSGADLGSVVIRNLRKKLSKRAAPILTGLRKASTAATMSAATTLLITGFPSIQFQTSTSRTLSLARTSRHPLCGVIA